MDYIYTENYISLCHKLPQRSIENHKGSVFTITISTRTTNINLSLFPIENNGFNGILIRAYLRVLPSHKLLIL